MNCDRITERLLQLPADGASPAFDAEEMAHLDGCPGCRERAGNMTASLRRIASAAAGPGAHDPGPAYWASVLPRLRERIDGPPRGFSAVFGPAVRAAVMPAAAAIVLAMLIRLAVVEMPGEGAVGYPPLSETDLRELRLAVSSAGILDAPETDATAEGSFTEFLSDLISEAGASALSAVGEPEELLHEVDDDGFTEIVSLLENSEQR